MVSSPELACDAINLGAAGGKGRSRSSRHPYRGVPRHNSTGTESRAIHWRNLTPGVAVLDTALEAIKDHCLDASRYNDYHAVR